MRHHSAFILIALLVLSLLWGCALSGRKVATEEEITARQERAKLHLSSRTDAYYHFLRSRQLLYQNRVKEALSELEIAAEADPGAAYLFVELATFYLRQGQNAEAVEAAQRARNLDPQSIKTRMMLAGLYSGLKQTDRAIAEYRAVLDLDPKQQKARL